MAHHFLRIFATPFIGAIMLVTPLSNGIRVVAIFAPGPVARCALVINAGSRDENDDEHGLAHFVEHTIFKGTRKRRASHILNRLDEVGGELNAYTTKDETAIHAAFLEDDLNRAVELIADMAFNSTFPERELQKEREVIIDEITSYEDTPSELVFDEFEELAFANTPLGHNILGTPDSVSSFSGNDARRFIERTHATDKMTFVYIGPQDYKHVLHVAQRFFGNIEPRSPRPQRAQVSSFARFDKSVDKGTSQAHVVLGCPAPHNHDAQRLEMNVLSNILGGPSMNSRLSVALRERNGIAYNVETSYTSFDDTGLFCIYFGTDPQNIERSMRIVRREVDKLLQAPLSTTAFNKVIRQYVSQTLMAADDSESLMLAAGRSAVIYGEVLSVYEIAALIRESVTPESLLAAARQFLAPDNMSRLIYS